MFLFMMDDFSLFCHFIYEMQVSFFGNVRLSVLDLRSISRKGYRFGPVGYKNTMKVVKGIPLAIGYSFRYTLAGAP